MNIVFVTIDLSRAGITGQPAHTLRVHDMAEADALIRQYRKSSLIWLAAGCFTATEDEMNFEWDHDTACFVPK